MGSSGTGQESLGGVCHIAISYCNVANRFFTIGGKGLERNVKKAKNYYWEVATTMEEDVEARYNLALLRLREIM